MDSLQATTFANTFLVTRNGGGPVLRVVGPEETRKKRPHRCDEGDPCRNCVKRKETCVRARQLSSSQDGSASPPPELPWRTLSEPECGPINLLHMELLHHFEQHTVHTLPFEPVWPRMLQLAFQSRQHTYLVNALLSVSAAHLDYLVPSNPRYHRAKYVLLDKALHDYRAALSAPITADNCDALLGTANLIQFLMWSDLSFMDGQKTPPAAAAAEAVAENRHRQQHPLDLSGDRLYWLSTGVRQIFFMAWPLFQDRRSVFAHVAVLQPCMALEDAVDALGLNWQRYVRGFMALYENPRYRGGRSAFCSAGTSGTQSPPSSASSSSSSSSSSSRDGSLTTPITGSSASTPRGAGSNTSIAAAYLEGLLPSLPASAAPPYKVMTLWQSYKEGEAYVRSAGAHDEALTRAAYRRLAARLAVAMAFVSEGPGGGCAASGMSAGGVPGGGCRRLEVRRSDLVRYVTTIPMMCFGPLLALISGGDSRMLVLLFHVYRIVAALLPGETYWWCRRRVEVMQEAIGRELRSRGLEVCLRRQSEV
ncbi:287d28f8-1353-43f2-b521-ed389897aedd [Thermothielavioides terrestris]|uniref:287d28f8-1353-43f2-b521-ed389897aedd n=1 Tax=Thermothielavioides terrestris TaxID=2587410 RepID=A0A3S4F256_9PEZI|nr:287d28f8-1353-43f2-b521-ed389897aedd [Thermothielavioides terrestris]